MVQDSKAAHAFAGHLATHYTDSFLPNREPIDRGIEGDVEPLMRAALALKWYWLRREIEETADRSAGSDMGQALRTAVAGVRRVGVPHHMVHGIKLSTSAHRPGFKPTSWFRMVLGVMNCESLNYLLLQWLRQLGMQAFFFEAGRDQQGGSHTLVLAIRDGHWAFVDAWTDAHLVTMPQSDVAELFASDEQLASLGVSTPAPGVPTHSDLVAAGVRLHPTVLMKRSRFLGGRSLSMGALYQPEDAEVPEPSDEWMHPFDPAFLERAVDPPAPESAWTRYLAMRNVILLDRGADAAALYESFLARERIGGLTRSLVEALAESARAQQ